MTLRALLLCGVLPALLLGRGGNATLSGLYADNGFDQTEIQRVMTHQEKREVEHEILNLLGLSRRPRAAPPALLAGSAPKFLLDVYESLLDTNSPGAAAARRHTVHGSEFNLSGYDLNVIDKSDVIMGFVSHTERSWSAGVRHGRGKRLWFDVAEAAAQEQLLAAELRLFQRQPPEQPPEQPAAAHQLHSYTITLHMLEAVPGHGEALRVVDVVNTTSDFEGWLRFNATGPIAEWASSPAANLGLYLSVQPADATTHAGHAHELHPDEIGIVTDKADEEREPFMVAFFKSSGHRETHVRTTRDTSRKRRKSTSSPADINPLQAHSHQWASRSCQMLELYVNFKDLHWQDWIIAPAGFQAYYCSGECNFPLNAHMNATNHAIVQTLVHLMNPLEVPKPCCAPTKLGPIQILYYLEDSNVTLKRYKNMVVKSCGCH